MSGEAIKLETLDVPSLIKYIQKQEELFNQQIKELKFENLILKEKYETAMYKQYVRSSEQIKTDTNQRLLFTEEAETKETPKLKDEDYKEVRAHKRRKGGRKAIDPSIPREEIIKDIPEDEKNCACGAALTKIGEESNEKLHITPPKIKVIKTIRPKYACRSCEGTANEDTSEPGRGTVRIAPVEPSIIPKGIATPSLLSHVITQKYEDHLPYYRQEKIFERIKIKISRQDMANWQQQVFNKIKTLFVLLKEFIKKGPVIRMDETVLQVMGEKDRNDTQNSYMWLTHGGPINTPVVLYEYRETRGGEHAKNILQGYSGYLQTDGYCGYDSAVKDLPGTIHVGCFTHARRKFFEAAKISTQAKTAEDGIEYIKKLYVIESLLRKRYKGEKYRKYTEDERNKIFVRVRQLCTWSILDEFKKWLIKQQAEIPPSLLLGKAVGYCLLQWDKLVKYRESPYLTPDNNICENAIRPFVLGRKNWLFNKSPEGAESSCGMYSLIQTAKLNGLNPQEYLMALFEKAPYASSREDWEKLLPWNISLVI